MALSDSINWRVCWITLLLPPLLAGLLMLAAHHAFALPGTDRGGELPGDTIMRAADNPHIVNHTLKVPDGVTLTIEPGAELYFAPGASLVVYGRLLAEGTPTQTILFTRRDENTYWGAIAILESLADNRITHAVIEYTREGLSNPLSEGVNVYNSRLTLADSVLRYTQSGSGVSAYWHSILYVLRNEIYDIQGDPVRINGGVAVVQGNHIYNAYHGVYAYEGIGIYNILPDSPALVSDNHVHDVSDDCLDVNDSWVVIERNRFYNCADKGISIGTAHRVQPGTKATSATVVNNLVYASDIGIAVKDSAVARLVHNTIADNVTDGLALYESESGYGGAHATLTNSILWGNGRSISLDALSTITVTHSDVEDGWPEGSWATYTPTNWGGWLSQDTTMHAADNPHIVNSTLKVSDGVTLTIEPGVELYFAPGASLVVYGRLLAEGTPTQTILFTWRDEGKYWGAISIIDSYADNRITHAIIEYTREGLSNPRSHGVTAVGSRVTLADSVLRHTQSSAAVTAYWDSTLYLLRNEIYDVQGDAVHPTGGVAVIQGNHIYNVRWGIYPYEGIEISDMPPHSPALVLDNDVHDVSDDCLDVNDSWAVIERNRIYNCADKGISIGTSHNIPPGATNVSATVINNLVYASNIGIAVKDSAIARLGHNTLVGNVTDGLALYQLESGYGGGHATVVNTILWGNGNSLSSDALSTADVSYSDVKGDAVWPGEGNINADPLFQAENDYHLGFGSPAINAGRDEGVAIDLDGRSRMVGSAPDMGAYELQSLLRLRARPGDRQIYLTWQSAVADDLVLASFAISVTVRPQGTVVYSPTLITGLPTTTLTYTLTDLINYAWYTVTVEGWDAEDGLLMRSNFVGVMPTDIYVYLPLVLRY
jgi:hypothetical protein